MLLEQYSLLTPEHILKYVSQEQLWTYYFGKFTLNKKYINPLRTDKKADCTFDYGKSRDLLFVDWAKKIHYTIWMFVEKRYNLNFFETLKKIAIDFNVPHVSQTSSDLLLGNNLILENVEVKKKVNRLKNILIKAIKPTEKHFEYWSTFDYKFKKSEFLKYKNIPINKYSLVFETSTVTYTPKSIAFCYLLSDFERQIYIPFASRANKFRQILKNPLIGLDDIKKGEPLIITKSNKDRIINKVAGFNVANILAENYKPSTDDIMSLVNAGKVFTLFDPDETGIEASKFWKDNYNTKPLFLSESKDSYVNYKDKGLKEHTKELWNLIK
jgi:hypothetical protein